MYTDTRIKKTVRLLARADKFNRLAKRACGMDRVACYRQKDNALDRAIREAPTEFVVDSIEQDGWVLLGLTHVPSGRRVHLVPYRLSLQAQVALHRLAQSAGLEFNFIRMADNALSPECLGHCPRLARVLLEAS